MRKQAGFASVPENPAFQRRAIRKPSAIARGGFTLVEILLAISLLAVFMTMGTVVFNSYLRQDQVDVWAKRIVACLNEAQAKTLSGYSQGGSESLNHGVHFERSKFVLFSGTSFDPDDVNNQTNSLPTRLELSQIELSTNNIVFEKITGEVVNFNPDQNFVVLSDTKSNQQKNISVNKLGVVKIE